MAVATLESEIWLALKGALDGLSTTPAMQIFDPGAIVTPPKDGNGNLLPFILVSDVRNDHQRISINKQRNGRVAHVRSGVLMLSIMWPIANAASHIQLVQAGGVIAGQFPADKLMKNGGVCLRVTQDADVMQSRIDNEHRVIVVRVFWSSI